MKTNLIKFALLGIAATSLTFSSCQKDNVVLDPDENVDRWITVSGALMKTTAGDGDGGTKVFSISEADAINPNYSVKVFDEGTSVKSSRTARLQASADGKYLYNIQYTGDDGGVFNKYIVKGRNRFQADGAEVHTKNYVSDAPRWLVAAPGVGIAVRGTANPVVTTGTSPNFVFKERTTKTDIISLDLNNPRITKTAMFNLALSRDEVAAGYYISRIDVPVVNKSGNKAYIGAAISKHNINSFTINDKGLPEFASDTESPKAFAKTLVVDYPSFDNPKLITTDKTRANTNGYRSTMQYIGTDGHVYQATSGEAKGTGGSKILRINSATNDYDNSYVFSLDQALGIKDSYIETWKYVGDGIGFVVYNIGGKGGYIARVDLNSKTAKKYDIPNEATLNFRQMQNIALVGDNVYIVVTPVSEDGNIYVFNRKSGDMTVGAKLINQTGNRYIGIY